MKKTLKKQLMSHKRLMILAFDKAKSELERKGDKSPSKNAMATEISVSLQENVHFSFGEKSLTNYYRKALNAADGDIRIAQLEVVDGLVNYLGFDSYQTFQRSTDLKKNLNTEKKEKMGLSALYAPIFKYKKLILPAIVLLAILIFTGFYALKEEQNWMIWRTDHYEKVGFSADLLNKGRLKLYNAQRIENFKKVEADCDIQFFNPDGSVNYWYGKNRLGKLEIFSTLGRHPETGKTLKPITEYMIEKYICP